MKKLNNKGFTLIELLAVVAILLIISVIAIPSISATMERSKIKQNNAKIEIIEAAANDYYNSHKNNFGSTICIELNKLNLSDKDLIDADGDEFSGVVKYESGEFKFVENGTC